MQAKFDYDGSFRNPAETPSLPVIPAIESATDVEELYDFMQQHEKNIVHKNTVEALRTLADKYPVMTRDMVSRDSVRQWLHDNIDQLEQEFNKDQ